MLVGACVPANRGVTNSKEVLSPCYVRPFGSHSVLVTKSTSPRVRVTVRMEENGPELFFIVLVREAYSLFAVLDLHARILRAHRWGCSAGVFTKWLKEQRVTSALPSDVYYKQLVDDVVGIAIQSAALTASMSHLLVLLLTGKLDVEMHRAFLRENAEGVSAHTFLIRRVFFRAPNPAMATYSAFLSRMFTEGNNDERKDIIDYVIAQLNDGYTFAAYQRTVIVTELGGAWGGEGLRQPRNVIRRPSYSLDYDWDCESESLGDTISVTETLV